MLMIPDESWLLTWVHAWPMCNGRGDMRPWMLLLVGIRAAWGITRSGRIGSMWHLLYCVVLTNAVCYAKTAGDFFADTNRSKEESTRSECQTDQSKA